MRPGSYSDFGRPLWTLLELCSRGLLQVLGHPNSPSHQLLRPEATRDTCRASFRPPRRAQARPKPHDGIQTPTLVGSVTSPHQSKLGHIVRHLKALVVSQGIHRARRRWPSTTSVACASRRYPTSALATLRSSSRTNSPPSWNTGSCGDDGHPSEPPQRASCLSVGRGQPPATTSEALSPAS